MLKCRDVVHQASDFVDKNLPWHRALGIRMHVMICAHCRRFMRHFNTTIKVARAVDKQEATETEVNDVIQYINSIARED
jgi:cytidine deaminase